MPVSQNNVAVTKAIYEIVLRNVWIDTLHRLPVVLGPSAVECIWPPPKERERERCVYIYVKGEKHIFFHSFQHIICSSPSSFLSMHFFFCKDPPVIVQQFSSFVSFRKQIVPRRDPACMCTFPQTLPCGLQRAVNWYQNSLFNTIAGASEPKQKTKKSPEQNNFYIFIPHCSSDITSSKS